MRTPHKRWIAHAQKSLTSLDCRGLWDFSLRMSLSVMDIFSLTHPLHTDKNPQTRYHSCLAEYISPHSCSAFSLDTGIHESGGYEYWKYSPRSRNMTHPHLSPRLTRHNSEKFQRNSVLKNRDICAHLYNPDECNILGVLSVSTHTLDLVQIQKYPLNSGYFFAKKARKDILPLPQNLSIHSSLGRHKGQSIFASPLFLFQG